VFFNCGLLKGLPRPLERFADDVELSPERLGDDRLREVALLKLEGSTGEEIAERLQVARRTVVRRLQRIRERWSEQVL
jgi:DNA-directed RNA polymerase specialized sigma24 family protein